MALIDNIVSYWKLDESSGNASDSVGSNTLTNSSVTYSTGKINNGAVFNASSAKLEMGSTAFTSSYTYSFWVYRNNNTNIYGLISKDDGSTRVASILSQTSGNIDGTIWLSTGSVSITPFAITNSVWNHVVITIDSGVNLKVYLNGSNIQTTAISFGALTTSFGTWFGADQFSGGRWFLDGKLDEIGWWSRALSSTEVTALYNSGNGFQYPFITYPYEPTNINLTLTANNTTVIKSFARALSNLAFTLTTNNIIFGRIYSFIVNNLPFTLTINSIITKISAWRNPDNKSSTTYTNPDSKSSSTWTNTNKNS